MDGIRFPVVFSSVSPPYQLQLIRNIKFKDRCGYVYDHWIPPFIAKSNLLCFLFIKFRFDINRYTNYENDTSITRLNEWIWCVALTISYYAYGLQNKFYNHFRVLFCKVRKWNLYVLNMFLSRLKTDRTLSFCFKFKTSIHLWMLCDCMASQQYYKNMQIVDEKSYSASFHYS